MRSRARRFESKFPQLTSAASASLCHANSLPRATSVVRTKKQLLTFSLDGASLVELEIWLEQVDSLCGYKIGHDEMRFDWSTSKVIAYRFLGAEVVLTAGFLL
jgi:hypothetical protein